MDKEKPDYEMELSEAEIEEEITAPGMEKAETAWCIEQDAEKRIIEIRPGSDGCISLQGAYEARNFVNVLEEAIQEIFSL